MEIEALTAVKMARELKKKNPTKAQKIFQHALTLGPNNHEVLLNYGEFLESCGDVVGADHFYLKVVMLRPGDSKALSHRERTLPFVNAFDSEELKRIDSKKNKLTLNGFENEDAYSQHVYHTVAIEGNTLTLEETRKIIEKKSAIPGKSISECNEVLGLDSALHYLIEILANRDSDILNLADILEIHKRIMERVDPSTAGTFRDIQVFVGEHKPPTASDIEPLMDELFKTIQSTTMHPIRIAAFAHHELVSIHPFVDGNGRTSRLAMNLILIKHGYPPITIKKQEKRQYFDLLQIANKTDIRPFYRFISRIVEQTIDDTLFYEHSRNEN